MPAFPYEAVTVRQTMLIRLGSESPTLPAGTNLTIHHEDKFFGTASVRRAGQTLFGSVPKPDYEKKTSVGLAKRRRVSRRK
jgi:hypothetical protein